MLIWVLLDTSSERTVVLHKGDELWLQFKIVGMDGWLLNATSTVSWVWIDVRA